MRKKRFFILYWSIVVLLLAVYSISDGIRRKENYFEVTGKVIGQIPVLKPASEARSVYEMMPQVVILWATPFIFLLITACK